MILPLFPSNNIPEWSPFQRLFGQCPRWLWLCSVAQSLPDAFVPSLLPLCWNNELLPFSMKSLPYSYLSPHTCSIWFVIYWDLSTSLSRSERLHTWLVAPDSSFFSSFLGIFGSSHYCMISSIHTHAYDTTLGLLLVDLLIHLVLLLGFTWFVEIRVLRLTWGITIQ